MCASSGPKPGPPHPAPPPRFINYSPTIETYSNKLTNILDPKFLHFFTICCTLLFDSTVVHLQVEAPATKKDYSIMPAGHLGKHSSGTVFPFKSDLPTLVHSFELTV